MIFAVVALALLMSSLDQTIVATALDTLCHDLHAPITWAGWTITAYSLGMVLMLPIAGKLSQRYGRRRIFLASVWGCSVPRRCAAGCPPTSTSS
ncbi:MAG: MFS transporter [Rhodanobacteraceae bacterium]